MGRTADLRPGSRFLREHEDAGTLVVHRHVEFLEEVDGNQVFAAAVLIGNPLALLARVVQVEHRGHGVDAQAVDVHVFQPEDRAGQEEVLDLVAAEIEDQRGPVHVLAEARVGVLVERRAVEAGQAVRVLGEMRRDPVQQHADAVAVAVVDEVAEVVGIAETAGRGEVAGGLVTPG